MICQKRRGCDCTPVHPPADAHGCKPIKMLVVLKCQLTVDFAESGNDKYLLCQITVCAFWQVPVENFASKKYNLQLSMFFALICTKFSLLLTY